MTQPELQRIFESEFSWDNWKKVMNFVFPEFKFNLVQTDLSRDTKAHKKDAGFIKEHGQGKLKDEVTLALCEVLVTDKVRLDRNIKSVRSLVSDLAIPNFQTIVAVFHNTDNTKWRFTLVVREFTGSGKVVDKKPESYTYVFGVGERGRTASERFFDLAGKSTKTLKDLEDAFSVTALSKKFFKEYKAIYQKFVDDVVKSPSKLALFKENTKEKQEKSARDFVKKMMGRLIFLYFLQKKGWLGCKTKWKDGDEQFMKRFEEKAQLNDSFYHQYLEPLFFDTLNAKREKHDEDCVIQKINFGKVPYLNGGLFEKDENHPTGLTLQWQIFDELFKTLNSYNFTIIEDDPEFKEVAVDPEMLGHIFENLLEDNKDKGAFYTPKEIVHYMCQESLYEYLKTYLQTHNHWPTNETEIQQIDKGLQRFVKQKLASGVIDYDKPLANALKTVKICDPAIGSGAFPMGLLNEIYHCVHKLHDESPDAVGKIWGIGKTWQGNKVKLNIIENSIYGVDIEKGAVDIARLRFWLSLILDEPEPKPLPNLEYKIVVGNSLVSKLGDDIIDIDWNANDTSHGLFGAELADKRKQLLEKISAEQKESFNPDSDKHKLAQHIRNLKIDLLINQLELMIKLANQDQQPKATSFKDKKKFTQAQQMYEQVQAWKAQIKRLQGIKQKKDEHLDFFDWKLDFPEVMNDQLLDKPGFDIVIGNPPYVQLSKLKDEGLAKAGFKTYEKNGDLYCLFYEVANDMLRKNGVLAFITSNSWLQTQYGQALRKYFIENANPIVLLNFTNRQLFETAVVEANIILLKKAAFEKHMRVADVNESLGSVPSISGFMDSFGYVVRELSEEGWTIGDEKGSAIKGKMEQVGKKLMDWDVSIDYGIKTGFNEAFILTKEARNLIIKDDSKSSEIIKPTLRGRDLKRYSYAFSDQWIICTFPSRSIDINKYPGVKKHLLTFSKERLEQSGKPGSRKKTGNDWFETQDQVAYWKLFEQPKIIWGELSDQAKFTYDDAGHYVEATTFFLTGESLKYLLAVFNAKAAQWYFEKISTTSGMGTNRWKKYKIEQLPVPVPSAKDEKVLTKLVDKVLAVKNAKMDSSDIEKEIDAIVFKLYNLTFDEVKVIDSEFALTEKEYTAINL